jgi:hypothetical protein
MLVGVSVEFVALVIVKLSRGAVSRSFGSTIVVKSMTLKTAQAPMSEVVMRKIASRIERTDEIICPGPLFPGNDVPDIS